MRIISIMINWLWLLLLVVDWW